MSLANTRDLTDVQWKMLDDLIPEPIRRGDGRGRPWKDRRAVLNGILWVLRTGAPWAMFLRGIRPTSLATDDFSSGSALE
jgi:transposase